MSGDRVDLSGLVRERESESPAKRRLALRYLLPIVVVVGIAAVLGVRALDYFEVAQKVTVVRPVAAEAGERASGALLLQAAGWVEPDPFPIEVRALTDGVLTDFLVQEGDRVESGQIVGRLLAEDAELELRRRKAIFAQAEAEVRAATKLLEIERAAFEAALAVDQAVAVAEATLAENQAQLAHAEAAVRAAEEAVAIAEFEKKTQEYLRSRDANAPWQLELAAAQLEVAKAEREQQKSAVRKIRATLRASEAKLTYARGEKKLRTADRTALTQMELRADHKRAEAAERQAALDIAELRVARLAVKSPRAAVVLDRIAHPGANVGQSGGLPALLTLYDPESLRVRVDVPQAQVGLVSAGQRAEIRCDVREQTPYRGEVTRIVSRADLQKVTLEVQVRVQDPDGLLRPDMLCQVAFFGREGAGSGSGASSRRYRIPARVLVGETSVYVVDGSSGRAALRNITIAGRQGDDVLVSEGLDPSAKVIDQGRADLSPGDKVTYEGSR